MAPRQFESQGLRDEGLHFLSQHSVGDIDIKPTNGAGLHADAIVTLVSPMFDLCIGCMHLRPGQYATNLSASVVFAGRFAPVCDFAVGRDDALASNHR